MKIQINNLNNKSINPIFDYCRKLIEENIVDPNESLEAYRGDVLCLTIRSIEEGSRMYVKDNNEGTPKIRVKKTVRNPVQKSLQVGS